MIYSQPITKTQAVEMYVNCFSGLNEESKKRYVKHIDETIDFIPFLKNFNKTMTIRLRNFAPNYYQIVYES